MNPWGRNLSLGWLGTLDLKWVSSIYSSELSCAVLAGQNVSTHLFPTCLSSSSKLPSHAIKFSRWWRKKEYQQKCSHAFSTFFLGQNKPHAQVWANVRRCNNYIVIGSREVWQIWSLMQSIFHCIENIATFLIFLECYSKFLSWHHCQHTEFLKRTWELTKPRKDYKYNSSL